MRVHTKLIVVKKEDLDELNHVNNIRYLEWVQQISKAHWQTVADQESLQSTLWVVRSHNITYYKSAVLEDQLRLVTQVLDWKGPISTRQVAIINNKTEETLVKAITNWCALDATSLRPKRIPIAVQQLF